MNRRVVIAAAACALLVVLAACERSTGTPTPSSTATFKTTEPPDVAEHESGPESPIVYGLQVPRGATQLGPLVRYRSARLISAYEPELRAALAQQSAEERAKAAEAEEDGTPLPSTLPTPEPRPSGDTFRLLEDRPKPDSTISLMRIDGKPSIVVRRMLAQITALLPDSDLNTDDLSNYCEAADRRIRSCRLAVRGLTAQDRDVRVTMTVDPGNLRTRTSPPSSLTRPVMTLLIEYVGEPRKGQLTRESSEIGDPIDVETGPETSGLIWPKMDEDAAPTTELVNGWVAPTNTSILLSGYRPQFVTMVTSRAAVADSIAQQFAINNSDDGAFVKDVAEDLNEVTTTYTATREDDTVARASYVLSARGNYTTLMFVPLPALK